MKKQKTNRQEDIQIILSMVAGLFLTFGIAFIVQG